jgi:predicted O-linked N-acetylglucosamine transferase (SPINDLY family)
MPALTPEQAYELALQHHRANRLPEAESLYRQLLASDPNHADALHMLGVLANQMGRASDAIELIRRAIQLNCGRAIYHNNLGLVLASQRQWPAAEQAFRTALSINPALPQSLNNLTNVLRDMGRLDDALAVISGAIELNAASPEALSRLGLALANRGRMDDAIHILSKSAELRPDPEVLLNLGSALKWQGRLDESNAAYERAIQLRPDFAAAHLNLATNFGSQALLDQALGSFRKAVDLAQDDSRVHTALLNALHYHPAYDAPAILREHLAWAKRFAEPLAAQIRPHLNEGSPERRIRLGYVSAEFRDHPVGRFLLPLFSHHDRGRFEICCYFSSHTSDTVTQKLQSCCDRWTDAANLSDEELSEKIRDDRIDILVDLALHTAGNRLLVFARKPAPVQVTWLAYPGTSGMKAMDYRLSDPYLDPPSTNSGQAPSTDSTGSPQASSACDELPSGLSLRVEDSRVGQAPGSDENYVEKTVRLADCFWCYQAPADAPPVNVLPAQGNGYVTFGCFNNFFKASPQTLELWARVLAATPDSRMLIHSQPGSHLDLVRSVFSNAGVDPNRLEFVGFVPAEQYWRQYHRIDIALDTSPYAGGTTTCDSLWMGVPVVTLAGRTAVGRAGVSILTNAGLADLVAQSPTQYVEIASRLAGDINFLSSLRSDLRPQLLGAPLMNSPNFTRDIEHSFRLVWRSFCNGR